MAWTNDRIMLKFNPKFAEGANFTPKEVAERLGISAPSVYHYIDTSELAAFNIGRGSKRARWIISEEDAEAFIKMYNERKAQAEQAISEVEGPKEEKQEKTEEEDARKTEKELLMRKLYYVKEAMLDLTVRMEEIERELEKF